MAFQLVEVIAVGNSLIDDTRAPGENNKKFFLTTEQHQNIAKWLNEKINIPFVLSEAQELSLLRKVVIAVDRNVMKYIPSEILDGAGDRNFQLEPVAAEAIKDYLVPMLLELVPLPFFRRTLQRTVINKLVDLFVTAIASKTTVDEMIEEVVNG